MALQPLVGLSIAHVAFVTTYRFPYSVCRKVVEVYFFPSLTKYTALIIVECSVRREGKMPLQ